MKLLVVDDHPVVLEGLGCVFRANGYEVAMAAGVEEAVDVAKSCGKIDMMVVDLTLKEDADGLVLIKKLRKSGVLAPAIVYTMHEELWNLAVLLDSDVEGIVLKGESLDELTEAVAAVGSGARYLSPAFSKRLSAMKSFSGGLSAKELNIINMIGKGDSTADIASRLCLTPKAVEYHRSNILKKLESKTMTEAIKNAVKLGIISCVAAFSAIPTQVRAENRPVAVDLGLSVRWADRNLGAESPLVAGGYYAFAETEEKERYDWNSYTHCDNGDMFSQHYLGEESISGTEYDAATQLLGDGWRLPTAEEIFELVDNCTMQFFDATDQNLMYARFSSTSGSYIDIPIAGYMSNSNILYENMETIIAGGSFESEYGEEDGFSYRMNAGFGLGIASHAGALLVEVSCHLGFQIRPVKDIPGSIDESVTAPTLTAIYSTDGKPMPVNPGFLPSGIYIFRYSDSSVKLRTIR